MMPLKNLGWEKHPKNGVIFKWKYHSLEQIWKVECTIQIQVNTVVANQIQGYQWGVSMDLITVEDPSDIKDHHLGIVNRLIKGLQGLWGDAVVYQFSKPPGIITCKFYENYINSNQIANGYG